MTYCWKEARTEASDAIVDWGYQAPSFATQDAINGIPVFILDIRRFEVGQ